MLTLSSSINCRKCLQLCSVELTSSYLQTSTVGYTCAASPERRVSAVNCPLQELSSSSAAAAALVESTRQVEALRLLYNEELGRASRLAVELTKATAAADKVHGICSKQQFCGSSTLMITLLLLCSSSTYRAPAPHHGALSWGHTCRQLQAVN